MPYLQYNFNINVVINDDKKILRLVSLAQDDKLYMNLPSNLQQIGLTKNQSNVYLACLDLGETRAQEIIRRTKLPRATVYLTLEELENHGLTTSYTKNNIKHFIPENPEKLINRQKEQAELAEQIFPELRALYNTVSSKPQVKFYRGLNQIKEMYNSFLNLNLKKYRVIGSEEYWGKADEGWFEDYARRRGEAGIIVHAIFEDSAASQKSKAEKPHGRIIKILPKKYKNKLMTSDCSILPDRVVFQNYGKELVSVSVESKEAAGLMELLFDLAWDGM